MKKISLLIVVAFLTQSVAMADCFSDFRLLQNKEKVVLKLMREVEIKSKKEFKNLRSAELKAVENYVNYQNFKFDGENSLLITNRQYQSKDQYKSSLGYKITVTDGGDESNVHYYIKIDVGMEDVAYPILYRVWDNQSPERDFLCQTY
jgi:hypothetical protein